MSTSFEKILLVSAPKVGKTFFATSGPPPITLLDFDFAGRISRFPGLAEKDLTVRSYPPAVVQILEDNAKWARPKEPAATIHKDILALQKAFASKSPVVKYADGVEAPLPKLLILDGITEWVKIEQDWLLAMEGKTSPDDYPDPRRFFGKRLGHMETLARMLIPLACHVVLTLHEDAENADDGKGKTGRMLPDAGGRLDKWFPGKADASILLYVKNNQRLVQTQQDAIRPWIGIRNTLGLPATIDVTVDPKSPVRPWEKVFGKEEKN